MRWSIPLAAACAAVLFSSNALASEDFFALGTGRDGALTVSTANVQINVYKPVTGAVAQGATAIPVSNITGIAAGDLVMIWQTQRPVAGAPAIGVQTDANLSTLAVGHWELARVASVAGTTVTLSEGTRAAYLATGAQLIRVPEYTTLTVNAASSVVAKPWDGSSGGVVAALVNGQLTNLGTISANSAGFRGGQRVNGPTTLGCTSLTEAATTGAQRGESLVFGQFGAAFTGRGNLVQGGGGGVCHNAGGGGGGHLAAGGLGGRSYSGDGSRLVGGLGGAKVVYDPAQRLMMGGGGGAGEENNDLGSSGGAGGGLVFLRVASATGTGSILANGATPATGNNDGQGGGGAGGAVILRATGAVACAGVNADGGSGGSMIAVQHGPGGGGAGGLIARQSTGGVCAASVTAGLAGTQADPAAPDGATFGAQPTAANRAMFAGQISTLSASALVLAAPTNNALTTASPTFSGTVEPNTLVRVLVDGVVVGTVRADAAGAWTLTPAAPLMEGSHTITAQAAGSINAPPTRTITVDATPPAITLLSPASGSRTNDNTPTLSGVTEPNARVAVTINGVAVGTVTAAANGSWSFTPATALPDGLTTASVRSTDVAGNTSQPVSTSFTIDTIAPVVSISSPANGALLAMTPPISGSAEPGALVTVLVDGMPVGTVTAAANGSWTLMLAMMLPDGPHSVTVTATDAAGNTSQPSSSSFRIDATAPAAPVIASPAMGALTNDATPTISGTSEPGATVTLVINGGAPVTVTADANGSWSFTPATALPEGVITVSATATDAAGNTGAAGATSFTVDTTAPAAPVIASPADGAMLSDSPTLLSGSAEPGATVAVSVDGMSVGTTVAGADGSWSLMLGTALADGAHVVTASATDAAGNLGPVGMSGFDITRLFVDILAPAAGLETNDATPTISGTATPGAVITILIDGMSVGTVTAGADGSWSFEPSVALMEGAVMIAATTTNAAGAMAQDTTSAVVDLTPPALAIAQPVDGATTNDTTPTISGTSEPGATVTLDIGGMAATVVADASGDWSYTPPAALGFGAVVITATAADAAGNTTVDTTRVTIVDDMGVLELTITSPANEAMIATREPTITGFTAPGATVEVFVDGVSVGTTVADANGDWSFVVPAASALTLGMHEVEVVATSGQETATVAINVEVIDATMTPVMIATPAMGALTNDATPTVTGTAAPGATVEVFVDGASVGTTVADANGAWTLDVSMLADGMHTIEAQASGSTATVGITVDTMAPVTTVTTPVTGGTVTTGTPVISGEGEPGTTVTISIDGMVVGTAVVGADGMWTFTPATELGEGMHTISVVGQDDAGNQSTPVEVQISVETPVVAPMVAVTSPAPGATVTDTTPTITGTATPGATVEILVDGEVIGTTVADGSGQWSFTPDDALEDGAHTIEARVTIDGESTTSAPITITVDGGDVTSEDSGLVLAGGCASAPGQAPDAAPVAALGLFALLGWRRRRR